MPPRTTFGRENILEAAIKIVREHGFSACSARTIARELGSSTMPVYSAIGSMELLAESLQSHANTMLEDYQARPYTQNPFVNMAIGYVLFARDEPNLFRLLFVECGHPTSLEERRQAQNRILKRIGDPGAAERLFASLTEEQIDEITYRSWVFVHGLAMLVNGRVLQLTEQQVRDLIEENGAALGMWVLAGRHLTLSRLRGASQDA